MDQALQKSPGGKDNRGRLEDLANLRLDPANFSVFDQEPLDARLPYLQMFGALENPLAPRPIRRLISLRATSPNRRSLASIKKAELNPGLVNRKTHLTAKRIDLTNQMPFPDSADRRVTRHLPDMVEIKREHQGARTHPRRRKRSLDPGMARANNNNIVNHGQAAIMNRPPPARKAEK
jgi:hypothetical protein